MTRYSNKGGHCGACETCGKCDARDISKCPESIIPYTIITYSENFAGILNQITAVFTRRQVNIESLNVCSSSTPGVHKYTITCFCTEETVQLITKQIEKKIDVLQARYYVSDQIYIQEVALFKLSTPRLLEQSDISLTIRQHSAKIVEVNETYSIVTLTGLPGDIDSLFASLESFDCVLQFVRSGAIAVTKNRRELLDEYLENLGIDH
ncbi:MAG: acetolactate synthase small subunit [Bacteroidaceae bacterium]|nr:acetolactate synthase small subunit [Bacteroidaceae bacterium]